ncbi:histidinol-phosphate transaminase [Hydrogenophaga sp. 5NK40-0174]|uniref:histidinol-phosphate transaminase n=1 Tax=Hydrogenophaga sp. 5NK40-0174 TaxID=3127649 RepID=UPI00310653A1
MNPNESGDRLSRLCSPAVRKLHGYVPGEQPQGSGWVKLNTNECPYPPSDAVLDAIKGAADEGLRRYPDPEATALRASIATAHDLTQDHVFVGNGSDEVLALAFMAFLRQDKPILFPDVTYSFYPVYCDLFGVAHETVPLDDAFGLRVSDYARPNGGIVFPNPNAPTGRALSLADVRRLLESNRSSVVIVDEAYVEFGADSAASLIGEFEQLLVVRTLSKSHALAGLRVGFAMGQPSLIEALRLVKDSFNSYPLDRLAQAGAMAAIEDKAYFADVCRKVMESRSWLVAALNSLGFDCVPSMANFILASHAKRPAAALLADLRDRRILVRHLSHPRVSNHLRISVGTQAECEQLVNALNDILQKEQAGMKAGR